jgi:hypothetical protein
MGEREETGRMKTEKGETTYKSRVRPRVVDVSGSLVVRLLDESEKVGALLGRGSGLDETLGDSPRVEVGIGPGGVDVVLRVCTLCRDAKVSLEGKGRRTGRKGRGRTVKLGGDVIVSVSGSVNDGVEGGRGVVDDGVSGILDSVSRLSPRRIDRLARLETILLRELDQLLPLALRADDPLVEEVLPELRIRVSVVRARLEVLEVNLRSRRRLLPVTLGQLLELVRVEVARVGDVVVLKVLKGVALSPVSPGGRGLTGEGGGGSDESGDEDGSAHGVWIRVCLGGLAECVRVKRGRRERRERSTPIAGEARKLRRASSGSTSSFFPCELVLSSSRLATS